MPAYVNPAQCDACRERPQPVCREICPSDIMHLDAGKAFNLEPDQCWECYACVKACPQTAIAVRGYADVMPMGGSLIPSRRDDAIDWAVRFRNGKTLALTFPIRTTAWGSIQPFQGLPHPATAHLKTAGLCAQEQFLGVAELPRPTPIVIREQAHG